MRRRHVTVAVVAVLALVAASAGAAEPEPSLPTMGEVGELAHRIQEESPDTLATPVKVVLLITLLSVLPAVLILTTSFTRIVIVLAFIRRALTTRNIPPAPVIVGLALFLSMFVMAPTVEQINDRAIQPYLEDEMAAGEAVTAGLRPLRSFMFRQTAEDELTMFLSMSDVGKVGEQSDVPTHVLIPAFVVSELKKAFQLGFVLFLPFLVLDLIVASVLLSMGMMMLPPIIVSAPLKILLFVLVDGWHLVAESLVFSFGGT